MPPKKSKPTKNKPNAGKKNKEREETQLPQDSDTIVQETKKQKNTFKDTELLLEDEDEKPLSQVIAKMSSKAKINPKASQENQASVTKTTRNKASKNNLDAPAVVVFITGNKIYHETYSDALEAMKIVPKNNFSIKTFGSVREAQDFLNGKNQNIHVVTWKDGTKQLFQNEKELQQL